MKVKRAIKIAALFLVSTLFLSGCSEKITEGEIYEKEYKPEKTSIVTVPIVHTNGKSTYTTIIPVTYHYPDRWCIRIRSLNKDEGGEYKTAEYYTTEEVYNECEIGDLFVYDEERDYEEEPVEKEK